jgi:hypothetical protein
VKPPFSLTWMIRLTRSIPPIGEFEVSRRGILLGAGGGCLILRMELGKAAGGRAGCVWQEA